MKKTIYFLLFFVFLINTTDSFAKEVKRVILGRVIMKPMRSVVPPTLYAYLCNNSLELDFFDNCDNLLITVEKAEGGIVYSTTINAIMNSTYIIDISSFAPGDYVLKIQGGVTVGYFSL